MVFAAIQIVVGFGFSLIVVGDPPSDKNKRIEEEKEEKSFGFEVIENPDRGKETLQEIGFECLEAADVDQALKLFDEEKVDLVIADTFMPEKNGMDLLKTLRENPENEELEIILTMMEDHEELVSQGEALGMTGYVLKPFDVFSLSKSLDQMHKKEE